MTRVDIAYGIAAAICVAAIGLLLMKVDVVPTLTVAAVIGLLTTAAHTAVYRGRSGPDAGGKGK